MQILQVDKSIKLADIANRQILPRDKYYNKQILSLCKYCHYANIAIGKYCHWANIAIGQILPEDEHCQQANAARSIEIKPKSK